MFRVLYSVDVTSNSDTILFFRDKSIRERFNTVVLLLVGEGSCIDRVTMVKIELTSKIKSSKGSTSANSYSTTSGFMDSIYKIC